MKLALLRVISLCAFCACSNAWSWQPQESGNDAVQLWTQASKHYTLVRAETVIAAPLPKLLPLLQDASNQHQWLPYTHKVTVISQPNHFDTLVHFQTQSQWPFKPRDAVTLFRINQPQPNHIQIEMQNQPEQLAKDSQYVRIELAEGYWLLTAQENCTTHIRYQSGSRWGGRIPQWLVNNMNRSLAIEALINLKQWAPQHADDYTAYDFINPIPRHENCP